MTNAEVATTLLLALEAQSGSAMGEALATCRRIAHQQGVTLYLVGGAVRDLLLKRECFDIDLVTETDPAGFIAALERETAGSAVAHDRFGTASVSTAALRIDIARARREQYPHPGSLPVVEPATLTEDLARRDFTINAVALRLEPGPEEVIDPLRGVADMRSRLVRVLHDRSFQDDATRMLRAVRYASRLGFKIATQTEALVRRDAGHVATISGQRLRHEFELLFREPTGPEGVLKATQLGVLESIHPALGMTRDLAARWSAALAGEVYAPVEELGFCLTGAPRDEGTARSLARWLSLEGPIERSLLDLVRLQSQSSKLAAMDLKPSEVTELLDGFQPAAVWAASILNAGAEASAYVHYLRDWRHVQPALTGDDLIAMGATPGPKLGAVLRSLRAARLDGLVSSRDEEAEMARSLL